MLHWERPWISTWTERIKENLQAIQLIFTFYLVFEISIQCSLYNRIDMHANEYQSGLQILFFCCYCIRYENRLRVKSNLVLQSRKTRTSFFFCYLVDGTCSRTRIDSCLVLFRCLRFFFFFYIRTGSCSCLSLYTSWHLDRSSSCLPVCRRFVVERNNVIIC